jgi:dTDP-glucose pyrophosphorylase
MGNRFGGLKQITPMGPSGEFILDYSVYDAIKAGFDKVIFIIKKENLELFKEVVSNHLEKRIKVEYAFQDLNDIPVQVDIP